MVIEAVSIMKEVKPKKVAGEKIGTKVDDYWEPGKAQLQDPTKFLESLFKYDKVCAYIYSYICMVGIVMYMLRELYFMEGKIFTVYFLGLNIYATVFFED